MSLKEFVNIKKKELGVLKKTMPLAKLKEKINKYKVIDFLAPFENFTVIAEIKKASPSEGVIDENADISDIAKQYERGGAGVISVLTDKKFFHGDINFLPQVKKLISLPILRKDFIIDEYQIYESRAYGADAVLLIVAILTTKKLEKFIDLAHKLGMECLVEVHNKKELEKISKLKDKIKVVGVNNRNLNTLKTDLSVIESLIDKIPKDKIVISESGVKNREDVLRLKNLGVNGILTGTSLMRSEDKKEAIKNLLA